MLQSRTSFGLTSHLRAVVPKSIPTTTNATTRKKKSSRAGRVTAHAAPLTKPSTRVPTEFYYRDMAPWPTDLNLPKHDLTQTPYVDLVVAGAGPAGVAVAERVAAAGFSVVVIDPSPLGIWPNNYGVWVDEFQAMGLDDCLEVIWPKAKVWLSNEADGEKFLKRPYARVDRPKLKRKLLEKCMANGVTFLEAKVSGVNHADGHSTISLSDGRTISGSMVLDATGHSRTMVQYDQKFDPGYQGAYGIVAEVESHPFDVDTMLFMDWRDDHTLSNPEMHTSNEALPTFLYAMPFSKNRVFLEETSLVARPAVGFKDLKERLDARLKWLGIKVTKIEDEEYCLIPMGGVLPKHPQRVIACGGTSGMVHPSTGFMMSRVLGAAPSTADAIIDQLSRPAMGATGRPASEQEANEMAAAVWRATWPIARIRQRAFNVFGMEVLLKLNLPQIRQFFAAFFSLSDFHWHGFLSTRLSFLQLIGFGLSLFIKSSNAARGNLLMHGVPGLVGMLVSLAPTFGDYYGLNEIKAKEKAEASILPPVPSQPVVSAATQVVEAIAK